MHSACPLPPNSARRHTQTQTLTVHNLHPTAPSRSTAPPPSCAVRVRFPAPVNAVALLDDDGAGAEALLALTSDGAPRFARSVEADAWEETLAEQGAWLTQLAALRGGEGDSERGGSAAAAAPPLRRPRPVQAPSGQHQALRTRVAAAWDKVSVLLPLGAFSGTAGAGGGGGGAGSELPLAEGRRVKAATWLAPGRVLLVCAPHAESALEDEPGDVLIELAVSLPDPVLSAAPGNAAAAEAEGRSAPVITECAPPDYAGGPVIAAAPTPGGVALLQLASGALLRTLPGAGNGTAAVPLGAGGSFPVPCPAMAPLPPGAPAAAVGLAANGVLYAGPRAIAGGVTSFTLREFGAGGSALLYTTRGSLLYTVMLSRLGAYVHKEVSRGLQEGSALRTTMTACLSCGGCSQKLAHPPCFPSQTPTAGRGVAAGAPCAERPAPRGDVCSDASGRQHCGCARRAHARCRAGVHLNF